MTRFFISMYIVNQQVANKQAMEDQQMKALEKFNHQNNSTIFQHNDLPTEIDN